MAVCTMMSPYIMANTALRRVLSPNLKPGLGSRPDRLTEMTGI